MPPAWNPQNSGPGGPQTRAGARERRVSRNAEAAISELRVLPGSHSGARQRFGGICGAGQPVEGFSKSVAGRVFARPRVAGNARDHLGIICLEDVEETPVYLSVLSPKKEEGANAGSRRRSLKFKIYGSQKTPQRGELERAAPVRTHQEISPAFGPLRQTRKASRRADRHEATSEEEVAVEVKIFAIDPSNLGREPYSQKPRRV